MHDAEQSCKIWINPDLVISKMAREIGWTFIRAIKSLLKLKNTKTTSEKIATLMKGGFL